jgi:hypothetical protein
LAVLCRDAASVGVRTTLHRPGCDARDGGHIRPKSGRDRLVKYENLRAAGKPAKVAIVAVMRKLIETAQALVKADRT